MANHIVLLEDLLDGEIVTVLASQVSTEGTNKKLLIVNKINECGELSSCFKVTRKDFVDFYSNDLKDAIKIYNE